MSPTGSGGADRGYVLLEVLVAAALLGVVLTVLVEGFGLGAASLAYLNDKWTAIMLARGLAAQPGELGGAGLGRFDPPFERFDWEIRDGRIVVSWSEGAGRSQAAGRKRLVLTGAGVKP